MKYRLPVYDATDLLILLLALTALAFVGVIITVQEVEDYFATHAGPAPMRDFVPTESLELLYEAETPAGVKLVDLEGIELYGSGVLLSTREARDLALHEGMIYVATDGGLLEYRPTGELLRHYTHLNGLLSNRISCLAEWRGRLYIGSDRGLVRLEDKRSVAFLPLVSEGNSITALLPLDEDRLLVGTSGAGLLVFDGSRFRRDMGRYPGAVFKHVTALALWKGHVVVGSRQRGLFIQRGAGFKQLVKGKGLPSNQVTAVAPGSGDDPLLVVATLGGLCIVDDNDLVTPMARPMPASAALKTAGSTATGTLDGRVEIYSAGRRRTALALGDRRFPVVINRIVGADKRTWILTSEGTYCLTGDRLESFGERQSFEIRDNHVAALAVDNAGRLWIGYFDSGIEVVNSRLRRQRLLDDDYCRTVKCLFFDTNEGAVYAGSSKGLLRFHPDGSKKVWTTDQGLISNEVNHVGRFGREIVAGTGGGLSFFQGDVVRSIYAFHGLINNKVFSVLPMSEELVVGTLGGVSLVSQHQVVGHITPENSPLPTHWITALCDVDGSLLVGTYGGGLALQRSDGQWDELPEMARGIEINPNAVLRDGDFVLVGTLDRGVIMYHVSGGRWRQIRRGLSSANVTALAADEKRIFIGTDNGVMIVNKSNL